MLSPSPVAWWACESLGGGAVQVLGDEAGANDGYVNPHWCDPDGPFYLPGTDVLFDYDTAGNVLFGAAETIDLGDNTVH